MARTLAPAAAWGGLLPCGLSAGLRALHLGAAADAAHRSTARAGRQRYCWVAQSFLDELAHEAGRDPLEFQLDLLSNKQMPWIGDAVGDHEPTGQVVLIPERFKGVLELVAENRLGQAHQGAGPRHGHCRVVLPPGLLCRSGRRERGRNGKVTVNHVWAAGDVGSQIINPQAAESMGFGGVIEGMSRSGQEITSPLARWSSRTSTTIR
jgi:isoquinoline 1-oxidoreductase beta subunit